MFISFTTIKGISYFLNISSIFYVVKNDKKNNAIVCSIDGDMFEIDESYDSFCSRLLNFSK